MWSLRAIEPSSSIAIASECNANEKLWFLWRHVKIQKCRSCIINHIHRLKCRFFLCFWVELFKTLEKDGQEMKISIRMKKFHYWVKYAVFIKNENEFLKNSDFWYTWSNDHIQQVFQISERPWSIFLEIWHVKVSTYWNSIILYRNCNSIWEEVLLFFCSILMSSFWHVLMLCIGLGHFHF